MEPFKKNQLVLDPEVVKNTLNTSLKNTLNVQKKPVKFTWKGLADFIISTDVGSPLAQYNIQSLTNKTLPRILRS